MKALHLIGIILLIVAGLDLGLMAFGWNVLTAIFGTGGVVIVIYLLIGLAALYELITHRQNCKVCGTAVL